MNSANPLSMYMRQPKIYIRLPSQGKFWPEGSLEATDTGEYPVYSMTAKDELSLKVPDALMNGQAVVDVIQHCMPNIKNAWHVTSLDLDVILIAIRLATYGEIMTTPVTVGDGTEMEYQVDLRIIMDQLQNQIQWIDAVPLADDLTAFVRPLNYRQISSTAVKAFETQKLMQVVNDEKIEEAEKVKMFSQGFKTLSDATISTISDSIDRIDTPQGSVSDPKIIRDFVENADKDIFSKVEQHLQTLRDQNAIKPLRVAVTDEMREKGTTGDIIEIPITFDPATFFV
jgi:hypothetical protein